MIARRVGAVHRSRSPAGLRHEAPLGRADVRDAGSRSLTAEPSTRPRRHGCVAPHDGAEHRARGSRLFRPVLAAFSADADDYDRRGDVFVEGEGEEGVV